MKAKELIEIIETGSLEAEILRELESRLKNIPQLPKMKPWKNLTPLCAAAKNGYTSIVKFLVEKKDANPKEENAEQIPLDLALILKHTETALYLISKMKEFDLKKLFLRLIYAVSTSQTEIINAILEAEPKAIEYGTLVLLEEAICTANDETILILLEHGANSVILAPGEKIYSAYYGALERARHGVLDAMINAGASPLRVTSNSQATIVFSENSQLKQEDVKQKIADINLTPLQILAKCKEPQSNKLKSANVLLAAGAGLNICNIPTEILALYRLTDSIKNTRKFMIIADQKQDDNLWKKRIITQTSEVEKYLGDPNWRFNKIQLLHSCTKIAIQESPNVPRHIEELKQLLMSNLVAEIPEELKLPEPATPSTAFKLLSHKKIESMNSSELALYLKGAFQLFEKKRDSLFQALSSFIAGDTQKDIRNEFQSTFDLFSHLIEILKSNDNSENISISPHGTLIPTLIYEIHNLQKNTELYLRILTLTGLRQDAYQIIINVKSLEAAQYKSVIKKHFTFLSQRARNGLYDILHDAKIGLDLSLAAELYRTENYSLALYYLIIAQRSLSQRKPFTNLPPLEFNTTQVLINAWMAGIYHKQGCYKEATLALKKSRMLLKAYKELIFNNVDIILETILAAPIVSTSTKECIALYQEIQLHLDLIPKESRSEKIRASGEELRSTLAGIKKHFLSINYNAFIDNMTNANFIYDTTSSKKSKVFIIREEYSKLSQNAIKLLTQTESITYKLGSDRIEFHDAFFLKVDIHQWFNSFITVLADNPSTATNSNSQISDNDGATKVDFYDASGLAETFSELNFCKPKDKIKTRPKTLSNDENKIQTIAGNKQTRTQRSVDKSEDKTIIDKYGFIQLDGFTPAIPVVSNYIPNETLFLAIPNNNPTFLPFLNLSYHKQSDSYHEIRSISEKGHNQQGVKLGSKWLTYPNQPPVQIEIARVKVLGADGKGKLRATGQVQQVVESSDKRILKLYVIDTVTDKKNEMRKKSLN